MSIEIIKTLAANAITEFTRNHNTSCVLSFKDGIVEATALADDTVITDRALVITRFAQNAGLTTAAWQIVGKKLYEQYTKELECQTHQKH